MAAIQSTQNPPVIHRAWWKEASVYQIYPASFLDSNGDGMGDIPGIISKLDYIKTLGVDIVWVCPVYKTPMVDNGYDISDYRDIHAPFGTLKDVEKLIAECHNRGMKCVMDLVVNHTSDQHKWFKASKSSKDSEYRDYYIWKKPKYDEAGNRQPPNNWGAVWGGSAWVYDEASDEYYLHIFAPEQPDLNWENPKVRTEVHDIIRFWLEKGVDGFRCDVINFISKVPGLPDAPITQPDKEFQSGDKYFACGPRLHEWLMEIGKILKEFNAFSVGEMPCVKDPKELLKAVGFDRGELNMIFHFEIVDMDNGPGGRFTPGKFSIPELKEIATKWQTFMLANDGWNALYMENHDQSRTVSRYCSDLPEFRQIASKMLATFQLCQSGTPYIYQGQELGMINIEKDRKIDEYRDLETLNYWNDMMKDHPNDEELHRVTMREINLKSRDNARTPMQWDSSANGGFSTATPWQRVNVSYKEINAASQVDNKDSVFNYWSNLLSLRKKHLDLLVYGDYTLIDDGNEDVFAYYRSFGEQRLLVVTNWRKEEKVFTVPEKLRLRKGERLVGNCEEAELEGKSEVTLKPYEAWAWFVEKI